MRLKIGRKVIERTKDRTRLFCDDTMGMLVQVWGLDIYMTVDSQNMTHEHSNDKLPANWAGRRKASVARITET